MHQGNEQTAKEKSDTSQSDFVHRRLKPIHQSKHCTDPAAHGNAAHAAKTPALSSVHFIHVRTQEKTHHVAV